MDLQFPTTPVWPQGPSLNKVRSVSWDDPVVTHIHRSFDSVSQGWFRYGWRRNRRPSGYSEVLTFRWSSNTVGSSRLRTRVGSFLCPSPEGFRNPRVVSETTQTLRRTCHFLVRLQNSKLQKEKPKTRRNSVQEKDKRERGKALSLYIGDRQGDNIKLSCIKQTKVSECRPPLNGILFNTGHRVGTD